MIYINGSDATSAYCEHLLTAISLDNPRMMVPFLELRGHSPESSGFVNECVKLGLFRRNLLQIACVRSAMNCVTLLLQPPYAWNPDYLGSCGWSPMHISEDREDFECMAKLAPISQERRPLPDVGMLKSHRPFRLATCLFWPQDYLINPGQRDEIFETIPVGTQTKMHDTSADFRRTRKMRGNQLLLLFALYMATPFLFDFDLWTGLECCKSTFWPIPYLNNTDCSAHSTECKRYPNCISTIPVSVTDSEETKQNWFAHTSRIWLTHQFSSAEHNGQSAVQWWISTPSLKEQCRGRLRRFFVDSYSCSVLHRRMDVNYMKKVSMLPLPNGLLDFLLYRELWPTSEQENESNFEPMSFGATHVKRSFFSYRSPDHVPGFAVATSFDPNSAISRS